MDGSQRLMVLARPTSVIQRAYQNTHHSVFRLGGKAVFGFYCFTALRASQSPCCSVHTRFKTETSLNGGSYFPQRTLCGACAQRGRVSAEIACYGHHRGLDRGILWGFRPHEWRLEQVHDRSAAITRGI